MSESKKVPEIPEFKPMSMKERLERVHQESIRPSFSKASLEERKKTHEAFLKSKEKLEGSSIINEIRQLEAELAKTKDKNVREKIEQRLNRLYKLEKEYQELYPPTAVEEGLADIAEGFEFKGGNIIIPSYSEAISESVEEFIKKVGDFMEDFSKEDPEKENKIKKILLKPIRALGKWLKEGTPEKTASEYEALSQLEKLSYNLKQFMFKTSTRKASVLIAGLLALVTGLITVIKLHQHYHIISKKGNNHHNHHHHH